MTDLPQGNEDLVAEAWFAHLNWAMQRRVLEVADSDEDMAHILFYYPLPFRSGRTWVHPIKGEVPDGLWTAAHLAAIRAHAATGPKLKKEQNRAAWTDITLEENERKRNRGGEPPRETPGPSRKRGGKWQAQPAPPPETCLTEDDVPACAEYFGAWAKHEGIPAGDDAVARLALRAFSAGFGAGGMHLARKAGLRP